MHETWRTLLEGEFKQPYFVKLGDFLRTEYETKQIFPEKKYIFRAFSTDLNEVKVVILGQDPYHTPRAAMGLAFSVPSTEPVPPSLVNIYKEINSDLGRPSICAKYGGDLRLWQKQGVLLLNNVLTVEAHKAGSHRGRGWEQFTEAVIKYLNERQENLVFILWGRDARSKKGLINTQKHLVIESAHPSPLSAYHGFFGSRPFSKTNDYLIKHNKTEIEW